MFKTITVNTLVCRFATLSKFCKSGAPSTFVQAACISSLNNRDLSFKKPAPWPYKEKKFTVFHSLLGLDSTVSRFDENTQLIVVDGNIASGKTQFAKQLAEDLGMLYVPEANTETLYQFDNGFDLRSIDHLLPKGFKCCDVKRFYRDPHNYNVPQFQIHMFYLRFEQYLKALAHILNTGQGVVMDRSVYSDFVFMEAMHKAGYLSEKFKSYYDEMRFTALHEIILPPTLAIYLDTPVDIIMDRIKKRNIDFEINSKVINKEYLETIEHFYKQRFLKEISKTSELLIYDFSQFGDVEAIVEDIERIDFGKYDKYDSVLREWRNDVTYEWDGHRLRYSNERQEMFLGITVLRFDIPELLSVPEETEQLQNVIQQVANIHYEKGYNPLFGDKGFLFHASKPNYWDAQNFRVYLGSE